MGIHVLMSNGWHNNKLCKKIFYRSVVATPNEALHIDAGPDGSHKHKKRNSIMGQQRKHTKREVVSRLAKTVDSLLAEQVRIAKRMDAVTELLKLVAEDADVDLGVGDLQMDSDLECDDENPEEIDVGGVIYKIGDTVELLDSRTRKWKGEGVLVKFCDKMASMKAGGKTTRRKCGNFRHVVKQGGL